ncbi:glycosyltransferase family 2 protein [Nocardioides sp.]|uniref:glycosyltransferase family 2 protein n=1 Tax=Nocardioides sp. TaxID=35761 RepID=UPI002B26E279|nr:glycosyltransferase family 2 protein [Nocardioides sp.]
MRWRRRTSTADPLISVVIPVFDVEDYLPACLDSVLAQTHATLEVIVVDDGSTDSSGAIADAYAVRDERVHVVHTVNRGLGAARNEGLRHATGDLLAFADSDDVVPPEAYATLLRPVQRVGADLVTGSIARWHPEAPDETARLAQPPWMRRLHATRRSAVIDQMPELLGDVFAWNKLYRREFWDRAGLSWPEGTRYEDQPTLTHAYLQARLVAVVPEIVYHWRIRTDGTSITQQRASLTDLRDRWATKRTSQQSVSDYGSPKVSKIFHDRVLAGDLHQYFVLIPDADDEWYDLLEAGVREFFGERSLVHSGLPPMHRLTGWLVEQGRREDAAHVMRFLHDLPKGAWAPRVEDGQGRRIDVPGLDPSTLDRAAVALRDHER